MRPSISNAFRGPVLLASLLASAALLAEDLSRQAYQVLEQQCFKCHGPNRSENGLRLDLPKEAAKGGDHGPVLIPGNPGGSLLVQVVTGTHGELPRMPRKGDPLPEAQVQVLRDWIQAGARWPEVAATTEPDPRAHWAFQPVRRPGVPGSPKAPHPIDAFIDARLKPEGLHRSAAADRVTVLRRLSLDLTGLPPTPEEVDAFVADMSPGAYATVVERLLASPHYGEKWGRHWLDAARYADSNGFEKDRTRSIWPYRDWVIEAVNADLPFDEFTREQLAGDLLAASRRDLSEEQALNLRVATGYLRNSMINMEGGVEPEKFRTETIIDRVDAVGRSWLGLTISCAQCHNHKYDPISQKEYFQFYDFLNQDVEPRMEVPSAEVRAQRAGIRAAARELEQRLRADPEVARKYSDWVTEQSRVGSGSEWMPLDATEWHSTPMKFEKQEDLSLLGGGDIYNTGVLRIWVDVPHQHITGFRLETLTHGNLPFNGPGLDGRGDYLIGEFQVEASPLQGGPGETAGPTNTVAFRRAVGDVDADGFPASALIDGVTTNGGWANAFTAGRRNQERRVVLEAAQPVGFSGGTRLLVTVHCKPGDDLQARHDRVSNFIPGRLRVSITTNSVVPAVDPLSESQRRRLMVPNRTPEQEAELFRIFLFQEPTLADSARKWDELWRDWPSAEHTTLALDARETPRQTRVFRRGDWQKPTVPVSADVPSVLNPFPSDLPRNRLGLAEWLVSPQNPLTARVIVNRVWQQYFGQGLVTTPEDFGVRSDPPSHPELLDWLASEFMAPAMTAIPGESGARPWSLKHLHRLIVHSETYRQSSRLTPELLERDPYNRLLARAPRFRVDAESVQDIALKASGLLSPKVGGPSVFPPLPDGVMSLAYGPIPWNVSEGDDRYRRAMYTFWKRSVPYPAMVTFDAPTAEQSCVRRVRSNTPLQALVTLNEPTFNQAARWLAWRTVSAAPGDAARAAWVFRQCVSRTPTEAETGVLLRLLEQARTEFAGKSRDAVLFALSDPKNPPPLPPGVNVTELAAWTTVTRAVLNLDETVTKE